MKRSTNSMKTRNLFFLYLTLIFSFAMPMQTCTAAFCDDEFDFDFDDFDFEPLNPQELLASALGTIVKKPLWECTHIPNGRDVLYLMPYKISTLERGGLVFSPFYNETGSMHLTFSGLFNTTGINVALEGLVELLADTANVQEVTALTPLLRNITLQDRKVGGFIHAARVFGPFIGQLHTSIFLSERNFWLSEQEQDEIREIIKRNFPDGQDAFNKDELVRYRFGLGDTRLKLGLNTVNSTSVQLDLGLEGIFPTSVLFSSERVSTRDSADPADFLSSLLTRIQQTILRPRLGNDGHFGLGVYAESKISLFSDMLHLWNRLSIDSFFSDEQDRLILLKRSINPEDLTVENLNEFLQQYLFPPVFRVQVKPGSIVNFVAGLDLELGDFHIATGYDFYYEYEENFDNIDAQGIPHDTLLEQKAKAPAAEQHKIFGDLTYLKKGRSCDFVLGLGGDATVASKGIGQDWTIYGKIGILF